MPGSTAATPALDRTATTELALASADRLALMPGQASFADAAGLVIGGGTAHEGLVDRGGCGPAKPRSSRPPRATVITLVCGW